MCKRLHNDYCKTKIRGCVSMHPRIGWIFNPFRYLTIFRPLVIYTPRGRVVKSLPA